MTTSAALHALGALGLAGAAGFLIGFEREWSQALERRAHSFAGARTFTLVGLVSCMAGQLSSGPWIVASGLLVIGALAVMAYRLEAHETAGRGGTTEVAIIATYMLGVEAGRGELVIASAGAVAVAFMLSLKDEIRRVAGALNEQEIHATLRFLAISVIVLPIAPDQALGPYGVFNPRELWLMVVLISGLSFLGYWLVKALGPGKGVLAMGLVGGLASSTATALSLSRRVREGASAPAAAAGIVMATVMMLGRVALILAAVTPAALVAVASPFAAAALAGILAALGLYRRQRRDEPVNAVALGNPFELKPALVFAAMLAAISLAAAFAADAFGARGLYAIAAISGLADLDAITLSAGKQAGDGAISPGVAGAAILIAILANTLTKGAMAASVGGRRMGVLVIGVFALMATAGVTALAMRFARVD
jgi:uncharacterized membrane protein (DUF4010 family)